jgi:hypothetical protein
MSQLTFDSDDFRDVAPVALEDPKSLLEPASIDIPSEWKLCLSFFYAVVQQGINMDILHVIAPRRRKVETCFRFNNDCNSFEQRKLHCLALEARV